MSRPAPLLRPRRLRLTCVLRGGGGSVDLVSGTVVSIGSLVIDLDVRATTDENPTIID